MKLLKYIFIIFIIPFCVLAQKLTPIPLFSQQAILVITDSIESTRGNLYFIKRKQSETEWQLTKNIIPISLGRNGLGNGLGLHNFIDLSDLPPKLEGDGRSPAGVFNLSSVFGHKPQSQMNNLKMPYIHITQMTECIDDATSDYYNRIISRDQIEKETDVDWHSSEKMSKSKICYAQGVVVEHNTEPVIKSSGSCIFIHNWYHPFETTAGCTVMTPENMKEVIYWLDAVKNPVLIQLTKHLYVELKKSWKLPIVPD